jgi:hypothetical protein
MGSTLCNATQHQPTQIHSGNVKTALKLKVNKGLDFFLDLHYDGRAPRESRRFPWNDRETDDLETWFAIIKNDLKKHFQYALEQRLNFVPVADSSAGPKRRARA